MAFEIITDSGEVYYELESVQELFLLFLLYLNDLECQEGDKEGL